MASRNNPTGDNRNNIQRRVLITPEQFLENQRWIQQRIALFTRQNMVGLQNYLTEQVTHGERARQQLEALQQFVNQGAFPTLPLLPLAGADPRITPVPSSPSAYAINQQPVAGPSSIPANGDDTVQMKPQRAFNLNPTINNVLSSSGRSSSREHQGIYNRQTSTLFSAGPANCARADDIQWQQTGPPHQRPPGSASAQPTPVQQSIHSSRPSDSRQTLYLQQQQQQQRPGATTSIGMQASSSQRQNTPVQTYAQLAISNQAPTAISSISGYYQGVSNTALSHPFTSSSLAGALGENVGMNVPIQQNRDDARLSTHGAGHQPSGMTTGRRESTDSKSFTNPGVTSTSASILPDASSSLAAALQSMSDDRLQVELHDMINKHHEAESHTHFNPFIAQDNFSASSLQGKKNLSTISQNVKSTSATYGNQSTSGTSAQLNTHIAPDILPETPPSIPNTTTPSSSRTTGVIGTGATTNNSSTAIPPAPQVPVSDSFGQVFSANVNVSQPSTLVGLNAPNIQDYYYAASHPTPNNVSNMLSSGPTSQSIPSAPSVPNRFTTPPQGRTRPSAPVTPASANKKTLAKDILRALNRQPEKRKTPASGSSGSDADTERPPLKRQATEYLPSNDPTLIEEDVFGPPSMLPFATEPDNAARIEEVNDTVAESADVIDLATLPADASEVVPLTSAESDVRSGKSSPPPRVVESRASSEDAFNVDTMLQPPEEAELPLFLPSPEPNSPRNSPHLSARDVRQKMDGAPLLARCRESRRKHGHVWEPYVEVPALTTAQRELYLKWNDKSIEATSSKSPVADEGRLRLAREAEAMSVSRLRRRPCLWNDCYYVANSANNLNSHVLEHAVAEKNAKIFPCWWGDCLRRFNKLEALAQHLQNHVRKTIFCAYEGCDTQVTHRLELLNHVESSHASGGALRPSTKPFAPPTQVLPPLGTMFAYQVLNLPIAMAPVSNEPRAELGSQDSESHFVGVVLDAPKLNARNQVQRDRPRDAPKLMGNWQDRYDFLERWTVKHSPNCEDLESSKATEEIENGIVLVLDAARPQGPLREQTFTSRMDKINLDDKPNDYVVIEDGAEQSEGDLSEVKIEDIEDVPADLSGSTLPLDPSQPIQAENHVFAIGEAQVVEPGSE